MRSSLAPVTLVGLCLLASTARADVPSPNQELCQLELQQRDGSQCLACQYSRMNETQEAENCAPAIERGYTTRCAFGGMWVRAVYCDREADFIAVARGPLAPNSSGPADPDDPAPAADNPTPEVSDNPAADNPAADNPAADNPAADNPAADTAPDETSGVETTPAASEGTSPARAPRPSSGCSVGRSSRVTPFALLVLLAAVGFRRPRAGPLRAP